MTHSSPTPISPESNLTSVLYVEDYEPLRTLIADHMNKAGYAVVTAADGAEGWAKFCSVSFDLVVTDLHMPVLDGLGFIRLIRDSKRPVRIMVYSSDMSPTSLATLRELGVTAVVPKLANWEILRKMMAGTMRSNP
jgi:CheY-like chemotaxis protein